MKGLSGISKLFQYGLKEARIFALVSPFMHLVIMIVIVAIIGYGGIRVSEGTMSAGSLIAFLLYLNVCWTCPVKEAVSSCSVLEMRCIFMPSGIMMKVVIGTEISMSSVIFQSMISKMITDPALLKA